MGACPETLRTPPAKPPQCVYLPVLVYVPVTAVPMHAAIAPAPAPAPIAQAPASAPPVGAPPAKPSI